MSLRELFADHYWDSFEADKDLIMKHIDAVLELERKSRQPAWDAGWNRNYEPVETRAAEIYATFGYAGPGEKPAWVRGGNSNRQDDARHDARRELREAGHSPAVSNGHRGSTA